LFQLGIVFPFSFLPVLAGVADSVNDLSVMVPETGSTTSKLVLADSKDSISNVEKKMVPR
jgi:hypothetical protein